MVRTYTLGGEEITILKCLFFPPIDYTHYGLTLDFQAGQHYRDMKRKTTLLTNTTVFLGEGKGLINTFRI